MQPPSTAPPPIIGVGPVEATLELLEWPRLSAQVASFAGTRGGREAIGEIGLELPEAREESEALLVETAEAFRIEQGLATPIDLRGFYKLDPLALFAEKGGVLTGEQLVEVASSLAVAQALVKRLRSLRSEQQQELERTAIRALPALFEGIPVQAELRRTIDEAVDDAGSVRDSAHPLLGDVRYEMSELASAARSELNQMIRQKTDALAINTITMRDDRYVLQVRAKQKHRVPGTVRDVSASGATLFIEPKGLEKTNTKLRQLSKQEAKLEQIVLKRLSQLVGEPKVAAELQLLQAAITRVDLAAARARYGAAMRAAPVEFTDVAKAGLELPALRHPLIVRRSMREAPNSSAMVPMDLVVPPGIRSIVITGPNTGGKTVCLKTLGMAALMARAGLWVLSGAGGGDPVRVPWFDRVMADIGDEQSIVQSLSTFSAHVKRIQQIMQEAAASPRTSLVLLDEIGSGTDPAEGSAIGMAVLRQLATDAALTMSTTHHSRLKTLKYGDPRFENACVEFDEGSMAPTYRLLWGIPGRSNAIAVADRLGLEGKVLEDARALLGEEDVGVDEMVSQLQSQKEQQRQINEQLDSLLKANERKSENLSRRTAELASEERRIRSELESELAAELSVAKAKIAALVREAQQGDGEGRLQQAQRASQELARLGRSSRSATGDGGSGSAAPSSVDPSSVAAGDRVLVPSVGGNLLEVVARQGKQLTVLYGGLSMSIKLRDVAEVVPAAASPGGGGGRAPPNPSAQRKGKKKGGGGGKSGSSGGSDVKRTRTAIRTGSNTFDCRGLRPSEIETGLGRAIDSSLAMGTLWVVHGRGTGALKKRVRELLSEEPMVARFDDAPFNEGGDGCTIAFFK